ncbi:hypothetical protein F2P79_008843 [Pimephales promelas]|nr:hypothetical protein F2P79_008843 [Pimephales promelas]
MAELDRRLREIRAVREFKVGMVTEIGGRAVDEAIKRKMTTPFQEYNFVGHHGKREFRGLKLFEIANAGDSGFLLICCPESTRYVCEYTADSLSCLSKEA